MTGEDHISIEALPRILIPPAVRATAEELSRRREAIAKVLELRELIGPIGIAADDLIHLGRIGDTAAKDDLDGRRC